MIGPQTAADDDLGINLEDYGQVLDEDYGDSDGYAVRNTPEANDSSVVPDYTPVFDAAIAKLRAQREGLSGKERLGALLMGFAQPTRRGKWQEYVVNAAGGVMERSAEARKRDEERRRELARLENARAVADIRARAQTKNAELRAGKGSDALTSLVGHKPNAEEIQRYNYAKNMWPDRPEEDLKTLMYSSVIDSILMRPSVAASAAGGGKDVGAAIRAVGDALIPTLQEFLLTGRQDNPGVSDADLIAYYKKEYGAR